MCIVSFYNHFDFALLRMTSEFWMIAIISVTKREPSVGEYLPG